MTLRSLSTTGRRSSAAPATSGSSRARTFYPRVEVEKVKSVKATVLMPNQALRLRARREFVDRYGAKRQTGEEWLVKESQLKTEAAASGGKKGRKKGGAYIAAVEEEIVGIVQAYVLTDKRALHLRARRRSDVYGVEWKAAQEWLVTVDQTARASPTSSKSSSARSR